jgi:alkanesulfonate monooxygenase SsuD/methylene tetrahydromethanopterin reductase-like flavin-dependent oxidoreductase (luciferase family)
MLAEAVEIIRLLWTGEPVSFAGRWYRLDQAQLRPVPLHSWLCLAGNSEPALRLAAAQADEWSTTAAPPAELAHRCEQLDGRARAAGRQPQEIVRTIMNGLVIGRDTAEIELRAERLAGLIPRWAGQAPWAILGRLMREWGWWIGTPEEVVEQAAAAVRSGFDRILFQVYDAADLEALDLLAEEVIPALRAETAGR